MRYRFNYTKFRTDILENFTITDLSKHIGFSPAKIIKWNDGSTSPKIEDFLSVCTIMNLSPLDYIEYSYYDQSERKTMFKPVVSLTEEEDYG